MQEIRTNQLNQTDLKHHTLSRDSHKLVSCVFGHVLNFLHKVEGVERGQRRMKHLQGTSVLGLKIATKAYSPVLVACAVLQKSDTN